ncbi:MAG: peptidylprolyl isomerase [Acidobacteria bacterium]|nr:peptidylprolyl isomerase [Acidobacteriota bacterium]
MRVNGVGLTERDLRREMEELFPYYRIHGGRVPAAAEPEIRQKAFDRLVLSELLYQEAQRRKLQISPVAVEARIEKVRRQFPSPAAFENAIQEQFGSQAEFHRQVRRTLLVETLWEQEVVRPSRVTEVQARRFYKQNSKRYMRPESVWLQTITFQFPEGATESERRFARNRAEEVLPQAQAAKTFEAFGALAERFSSDDWRVMRGDHGWVHRGTLEPELELAFRTKPGEISGIVASHAGFHILRVNGYRPETLLRYEEARAAVRKSYEDERLQKRRQQFEQELRSKSRIEKP